MTNITTTVTPSCLSELIDTGKAVLQQVPTGSQLFCLGDECKHYVVVQSGTVRVELLSVAGQQLLLYRIEAGQSCVMTTSCLLGDDQYHAQAIAETDVTMILIPQKIFRVQIENQSEFRDFVFDNFSVRLAAMIKRTTELATQTIDQRLAAALLAHAGDGSSVSLTHQQLAIEIGSAREVISRRLAQFEKKEVITRQRGHIEITEPDRLAKIVLQ